MKVYDFDHTIYDGDSTIDFYFYVLRHAPVILCCLPKQLWGVMKYGLGICSKTQWKENFFCFMNMIREPEKTVEQFWDKNIQKIKSWYMENKSADDVVISASPSFLLRPACDRLGIGCLIASEVDIHTGKFSGKNCYGTEKVYRFKEAFEDGGIDEFYSDSESDLPMALLAEKSFLVKKNEILPWDVSEKLALKRAHP